MAGAQELRCGSNCSRRSVSVLRFFYWYCVVYVTVVLTKPEVAAAVA